MERQQKIDEYVPMVYEKKYDTTRSQPNIITTPPEPMINFEEKVSPKQYGATYYQFTIETFGWFNIDVLIKDRNGVEESELFVRIIGEFRQKLQVYLIIPSVKVYVQGGPAERNEEDIAFQYKNGKIDLPQNARAFILAVTEDAGAIAYTIKEFTTTKSQDIEISLSKATKEEFNRAIKLIGGDGITIGVEDAENAKELRSADEKIKSITKELDNVEKLRPKNCDCDCNYFQKDTLVN
jgi:hypothetical protein